MASWRMRPSLGEPVQPKKVERDEPAFEYEPPAESTLSEVIRFHVNELVKLCRNMPGRVAMVLKELREVGIAPKARKRK